MSKYWDDMCAFGDFHEMNEYNSLQILTNTYRLIHTTKQQRFGLYCESIYKYIFSIHLSIRSLTRTLIFLCNSTYEIFASMATGNNAFTLASLLLQGSCDAPLLHGGVVAAEIVRRTASRTWTAFLRGFLWSLLIIRCFSSVFVFLSPHSLYDRIGHPIHPTSCTTFIPSCTSLLTQVQWLLLLLHFPSHQLFSFLRLLC